MEVLREGPFFTETTLGENYNQRLLVKRRMICCRKEGPIVKIYGIFNSYPENVLEDIIRAVDTKDIVALKEGDSFVQRLFQKLSDTAKFVKINNIVVNVFALSDGRFPEDEFVSEFKKYSGQPLIFWMHSCGNNRLPKSIASKLDKRTVDRNNLRFGPGILSPLCQLSKILFMDRFSEPEEFYSTPLKNIIETMMDLFRSQKEAIRDFVLEYAYENLLLSLGSRDTEDMQINEGDLGREMFNFDFNRILKYLNKFFEERRGNFYDNFLDRMFRSTEMDGRSSLFSEPVRAPTNSKEFDLSSLPFRAGGPPALSKGIYMINANGCDSYLIIYDYNGHRRTVMIDGGFGSGEKVQNIHTAVRETWNLLKHVRQIDAWVVTNRDLDHYEVFSLYLRKYLKWESDGKRQSQRMPILKHIILRDTLFKNHPKKCFESTHDDVVKNSGKCWKLLDADDELDRAMILNTYGIRILNLRKTYSGYKDNACAESSCSLSFTIDAEDSSRKCVFTSDSHTDYIFGLNGVGTIQSGRGPCFFSTLPHHGSRVSTNPDFFDKQYISPQMLAVACPPDWKVGAPSLDNLRRMKQSVSRTWDYVDTSGRSFEGGKVWFYRKRNTSKRNTTVREIINGVPNFSGYYIGFY